MSTRHKVLLLAAGVAILLLAAVALRPKATNCPDLRRAQVVINDQDTISVGLAESDEERKRGLMFCSYVPPQHGLWFTLREPGTPSFWMKNTLVPLDIVWIADEQIVGIARDVQPAGNTTPIPTYQPPQPVTAVLEVPAGAAKNWQPGQSVRLIIPQ